MLGLQLSWSDVIAYQGGRSSSHTRSGHLHFHLTQLLWNRVDNNRLRNYNLCHHSGLENAFRYCFIYTVQLKFFKFVVCNLCQSSPSLTILVPLWFITISLVFFYLCELLFSGFLQFKGNPERGQTNCHNSDRAFLRPFSLAVKCD